MGCDGDRTHLEKVIENKAMLACEEAEASPKKESLYHNEILATPTVRVTETTDVPSYPCLFPGQ
jgi:hypothetical protein